MTPAAGPIEKTVTMIVRVKAPDWESKKNEREEFIYYYEDWTANDWLGIPIDPFSEHVEGKYTGGSWHPPQGISSVMTCSYGPGTSCMNGNTGLRMTSLCDPSLVSLLRFWSSNPLR